MSELEEEVRSRAQQLAAAARSGDAAEAARAADLLLVVDDSALTGGDPAIVRELLDAAGVLSQAGDLPRATSLLVKGINALAGNPSASRVDLVIPFHNLMAVYDQAGRPADRDQVGAILGGLAQTIDGPLPFNAMLVFLQLGKLYQDAGLTDAALTMYGPVHRYMTTQGADDPDTLWKWLLRYTAVLLEGGRHDQVVEVCRLALSVHERRPGAEAAEQVQVLVAMATAASATGDRPLAQEALEQAVRIAGDAPPAEYQDAAVVANHNLGLLYLELDRPDRYEQAEELVGRALALVMRAGWEGTAHHADEIGQLGVIAHQRGDLDVAEQRYLEAIGVYARARGVGSPQFSDFLTDLGLLRLTRGHAAEAVEPLRQAVELRTDESAARRVEALSNLATAHFEAAQLEAASREYWRAVDLRLQT